MSGKSSGSALNASEVVKTVDGPDGPLTILDRVSLDVAHGDSFAIVGASGSGKTTLLGLLAGLDSPTSGSIALAGTRLDGLDEEARARLRRSRVGFVFQNFHLLPALNAEENVMLPLDLDGRRDARERAADALRRVGLGARRHHFPAQLSGGEQQRVALARAFVHGPDILFADEPTGNLDQRTGADVGDLLFELNREHATTLVLVTHDPKLAARCARSLVLDKSAAEGGAPPSLSRKGGDGMAIGEVDGGVEENQPGSGLPRSSAGRRGEADCGVDQGESNEAGAHR